MYCKRHGSRYSYRQEFNRHALNFHCTPQEAELKQARETERAKAKAEEEERLKELNARVQQLRDAHEKSASTIAEKERELFGERFREIW